MTAMANMSLVLAVALVAIPQTMAFSASIIRSHGGGQHLEVAAGRKSFTSTHAVRGDGEYEEALGVLIFSSTGAEAEISRDLETYDLDFRDWLNAKATAAEDEDESEAFESIADMVFEVGLIPTQGADQNFQ